MIRLYQPMTVESESAAGDLAGIRVGSEGEFIREVCLDQVPEITKILGYYCHKEKDGRGSNTCALEEQHWRLRCERRSPQRCSREEHPSSRRCRDLVRISPSPL